MKPINVVGVRLSWIFIVNRARPLFPKLLFTTCATLFQFVRKMEGVLCIVKKYCWTLKVIKYQCNVTRFALYTYFAWKKPLKNLFDLNFVINGKVISLHEEINCVKGSQSFFYHCSPKHMSCVSLIQKNSHGLHFAEVYLEWVN